MPLERPSFALTLIIFFLRAALSKGCLFTARWLALPQIRLPTPQTHKTCPSSPTSPLPQSLHNPYKHTIATKGQTPTRQPSDQMAGRP
ncbi:hypothetical protein BKA80DRAFT_274872 [Phyllosticta citrichinensis]